MTIERVGAVTPAPALLRQGMPKGDAAPATVKVGDRLPLHFDGNDADGLWLRHGPGTARWHLQAPPGWGGPLAVGDLVWVRVLATSPRLELEWLPQPRATTADGAADLPAMRMDQAGLRGHHWHLPPSRELAAAWRVMLRAHGLLGRSAPGGDESAALLPTLARPLLTSPAPGAAGNDWHWDFPVYAWGGLSIMLRVRPVGDDGGDGLAEVAEDSAWLEVELMLPGLGEVKLQLQARQGGVAMALLPRQARALPLLHAAVKELASALARLGCPLLRCQLGQALPRLVRQRGRPQAPAVPPLLLAAAAETVGVLARRWPASAEGFSPESPR